MNGEMDARASVPETGDSDGSDSPEASLCLARCWWERSVA